MHTKKRNGRVLLYRSSYVRKGVNGNTHGYAVQEFVGSLPADAREIPVELAKLLEPNELEYVESKVVLPARRAAVAARSEAEAHERDPGWRVDEALRLLIDAGRLASETPSCLDAGKVTALTAALGALSAAADARRDPLEIVLRAVQAATNAVSEDYYGSAPPGPVRDTDVNKAWRAITNAVDGADDGLLRALQAKHWAAVRTR